MSGGPSQPSAAPPPQAAPDAPSQTASSEPAAEAPEVRPGAPPQHIYDAVTTQREHVLGSFDAERQAILKAVADQREAALGPVRMVQARQAAQAAAAPPGTPASRLMAGVGPQQLVAADIVSALKAMIAEEVHNQIIALLEKAGRQAQPAPAAQPETQR